MTAHIFMTHWHDLYLYIFLLNTPLLGSECVRTLILTCCVSFITLLQSEFIPWLAAYLVDQIPRGRCIVKRWKGVAGVLIGAMAFNSRTWYMCAVWFGTPIRMQGMCWSVAICVFPSFSSSGNVPKRVSHGLNYPPV